MVIGNLISRKFQGLFTSFKIINVLVAKLLGLPVIGKMLSHQDMKFKNGFPDHSCHIRTKM
jgi:hypothetical protein